VQASQEGEGIDFDEYKEDMSLRERKVHSEIASRFQAAAGSDEEFEYGEELAPEKVAEVEIDPAFEKRWNERRQYWLEFLSHEFAEDKAYLEKFGNGEEEKYGSIG